MTWADAIASIAVQDGLLAQRKLDGDPDIIATDDHDELQYIVSRGKHMEGVLRRQGKQNWIRMAYERATVVHVGEEDCHDRD